MHISRLMRRSSAAKILTSTKGKKRGGARIGAGRKPITTDGGPMQRRTVTLDATTIAILTPHGDGELSEGIRRAARRIEHESQSSRR